LLLQILITVALVLIVGVSAYTQTFNYKKNKIASSVFHKIYEEQMFDEYEPHIKEFVREMHHIDKDLFRHSNWKLMSNCLPVKASLLMFRHTFIEMIAKLWSPEIRDTKELRYALAHSKGFAEIADLYLFMYAIISDNKITNALQYNNADRYLIDYTCERIDSVSKRIKHLTKSTLDEIDGTRNRVKTVQSEEAIESFVREELAYNIFSDQKD
jgi:hypothetical protein